MFCHVLRHFLQANIPLYNTPIGGNEYSIYFNEPMIGLAW